MSLLIKNRQNNWAYVLIVAVITFIAAIFIIFYTSQTIKEINRLSSPERYQLIQ